MKILVVVSEFPKITETFAIANVLHYLRQGHDARVFHLKPFRHAEIVHDEARPVVERGFTFPWLPLGPFLAALLRHPVRMATITAKLVAEMWREPRRLAESFAILPKSAALAAYARAEGIDHIHAEFATHPATAAWIAAELSGLPFSFSAHMYDIFVSQSLLAEKSRKARFVRTISDFNRDFLARIPGFDSAKLRVIRCGVDPARFPAPERQPKAADTDFNITFVGALLPRKGVDILLHALARLAARPDWHLNVHGGGPEMAQLQQLATRTLPGRVTFHGPATMAEVKAAMYSAHLVVIPSITDSLNRSEGIPVVSMEALAAEAPVIASRLSGIPELVQHGKTGFLFTPGDAADLAARITQVLDAYPAAQALAARGRAQVLDEYNLDNNAADLLRLIEENSR
ncbi:glycosyltransferase family 4 protein [Paragemmobacter straminiformis]|uniref:Glycosyltransferase family 4 protein n=1 Tax=Paragemmobacter straminiformis TaxID=2045119 RepID=A0A842I731_9RHOB|nr:glycosyltransferase family 4 protein [Gemmobacter straminiformis]MBC2835213.1 glycosyltransferase family 4 protein [Gemmobacter straminiformis]